MTINLGKIMLGIAITLGLSGIGWVGAELHESNGHAKKIEAMGSQENINKTIAEAMPIAMEHIGPYLNDTVESLSAELVESWGMSPEEIREILPILRNLTTVFAGFNATEIREAVNASKSTQDLMKDINPSEIKEALNFWKALKESDESLESFAAVSVPHALEELGNITDENVSLAEPPDPLENESSSSFPREPSEEVSTEPACDDEYIPGSASGGFPGGPPDRITGTYCGEAYECDRDSELGPPTEPVYRCRSASTAPPPETITGRHDRFSFRCTLDARMTTSVEAVYRCRAETEA